MPAVDIDVYAHIGNIDALKDDLAACRVFHAVKTAQKGVLPLPDGPIITTFSPFDGGCNPLKT